MRMPRLMSRRSSIQVNKTLAACRLSGLEGAECCYVLHS